MSLTQGLKEYLAAAHMKQWVESRPADGIDQLSTPGPCRRASEMQIPLPPTPSPKGQGKATLKVSPPWLSVVWPRLFIVGALEKRKSQSSAMSPASPDPENQSYFQGQPCCCKLSLTEHFALPLPCRVQRFCRRGNRLKFGDGFGVALLTMPHQALGMGPACLGCAGLSAQTLPCYISMLMKWTMQRYLCLKHAAKENWHYHSHFTGWRTEGMWILHGLSGQCHCRK